MIGRKISNLQKKKKIRTFLHTVTSICSDGGKTDAVRLYIRKQNRKFKNVYLKRTETNRIGVDRISDLTE